ncbi:pseudouridine synthase [Nocardia panacis]|uniref:pseudouridine synthase n=1 Tax=Nocardia panacis TaxID=2340916 RepID=UPI00193A334C|nr:pseudouridine synthase [Nocardia panacis]
MNTPARRDGTPDRRKQPTRGGASRTAGTSRGARAAQRGNTDWERGARRGEGAPQRDSTRRGSGSWSDAPAGSGSRWSDGPRGRGDAPRRDEASRWSDAPRGRDSRRGDAPRRDDESRWAGTPRGKDSRRGDGPRREEGPRRSDAPRGKDPRRGESVRRAGDPTPARKANSPKPQRRTAQPVVLSNAKLTKHQHVDTPEGGHTKLPWGEGERLQKVLAKAGVASRRAAEEMIAQGRVEVDGAIVTEQGLRIDPDHAVVRVDGARVVIREELVHLALNKPKGWQSTMSDDLGRPCVGDIVAERVMAGQRLFHVGRLDADTEGLLLLTNDGDLAHRLMHPSYEVSKTYLATVNGEVNAKSVGRRLRDGVELEDGPARVDKFQVLELGEGRSLVKLVLHEGRKHIVRRLLDAVGHPVVRLVRTNIGPVVLGDQRPGTLRVLGRDEVGKLYEAVSL